MERMTERIIDEELKLIPYYRNDEASLPWYQDLDVCKQVDNRDEPYDLDLLHAMYDSLKIYLNLLKKRVWILLRRISIPLMSRVGECLRLLDSKR